MRKKNILILLLLVSARLMIAESPTETAIKKEWLETIEHSLEKKNKFKLPTEKVLASIEDQIIKDFGSFEAFDRGFKKRSIRHIFGYLRIVHDAKKQLFEEKWKEEDLK